MAVHDDLFPGCDSARLYRTRSEGFELSLAESNLNDLDAAWSPGFRKLRDPALTKMFRDIRNLYFPRWDRANLWRATYGDDKLTRDSTGYCDSTARTIYFDMRSFPLMPEPGRRALMIHEICHDVGGAQHKRRWALRMEKAGVRAGRLGEVEVAEILHSEIYSYFGNGAWEDYTRQNVVDFALARTGQHPDFDGLVKRLAKFFGVRPSKLRRNFGPAIKKVFEEANYAQVTARRVAT